MSKLEIIELVVLVAVILVLSIYYIVKAIKNGWVKELINTLEIAIKKAEEEFPAGSGAVKKEFVIKAIKEKCIELGIPYAVLEKLISKLIDDYIKKYNVFSK